MGLRPVVYDQSRAPRSLAGLARVLQPSPHPHRAEKPASDDSPSQQRVWAVHLVDCTSGMISIRRPSRSGDLRSLKPALRGPAPLVTYLRCAPPGATRALAPTAGDAGLRAFGLLTTPLLQSTSRSPRAPS